MDSRKNIYPVILLALAGAPLVLVFYLVGEYSLSLLAERFLSFGLIIIGLLFFSVRGALRAGGGLCAIFVVSLVFAIAEAGSYYIQAVGFNDFFFIHLFAPGGFRGLFAYPLAVSFSLSIIILVAVFSFFVFVSGVVLRRRWLVAVLVLLVGVHFSAIPSFVTAYSRYASVSDSAGDGQRFSAPIRKITTAKPGKNLVLIYVESFDSVYLAESIFPGLMPNVSRLMRRGRHYSGMTDYPGVGFTMAGIFASQCGIPLIFGGDSRIDRVTNNISRNQYGPSHVCLGDVLRKAGYHQVFLGGADAKFAGKDSFFDSHGYDSVLGLAEWRGLGVSPDDVGPWGVYDDELFERAAGKFAELSAAGKPFNLTVLTIDMHGPNGMSSPSCTPYSEMDNTQLNAVHCTDQVLGRFFDEASTVPGFEDAVFVVMGDHASMRNVAHQFYPDDYIRAPVFFMLNAGGGDYRGKMYHMDIAPTILGAMGVVSDASFVAGWKQDDPVKRVGESLAGDRPERQALAEAFNRGVRDVRLCRGNNILEWDAAGAFLFGDQRVRLRDIGYLADSVPEGKRAIVEISQKNVSYYVDHGEIVKTPGKNELYVVIERSAADGHHSIFFLNEFGGSYLIAENVSSPRSLSIARTNCDAFERFVRSQSSAMAR